LKEGVYRTSDFPETDAILNKVDTLLSEFEREFRKRVNDLTDYRIETKNGWKIERVEN